MMALHIPLLSPLIRTALLPSGAGISLTGLRRRSDNFVYCDRADANLLNCDGVVAPVFLPGLCNRDQRFPDPLPTFGMGGHGRTLRTSPARSPSIFGLVG